MATVPTAQHPCDQSNFRPVSVLSYPTLRGLQLRQGLNSAAKKQTVQFEIQQTNFGFCIEFVLHVFKLCATVTSELRERPKKS